MAKTTIQQELKVILWGEEIGRLSWDERNNNSFFFFSPTYFKLEYDISPILYPKNSTEAKLPIIGIKDDKIYQKLPPFIADSLPDEWGNAIFNEWFAANKFKSKDKTPLTKLSFIGTTAMGAIEFVPVLSSESTGHKLKLEDIYHEAKVLEAKINGLSVKEDTISTKNLQALGTSPGGRHSKAIISQKSDGTFISGKTSTDPNCKHYIIKFNTPEYSISETEMVYHDLALLSGIEMMPSGLKEIDGVKHFLTERFDRHNGRKVFMQTFAALNNCEQTYENLFKTCRLLNLKEPELEEMFRRTAFNFLMNNTDDHRKNFSFIMREDGIWSLAPSYDVTFIFETGNKACETHCMSLNGKYSCVTEEDLLLFANKVGIKKAQQIIHKIATASLQFRSLAAKYGVRNDIAELIDTRLEALRPQSFKTIAIISSLSFRTNDGILVRDVRFERSEKGNIHLTALVDNRKKKYIFTPKREEYQLILDAGFNEMPDAKKKELVLKYLVTKKY